MQRLVCARSFSAGLKGRFNESALGDDHQLENASYPVLRVINGRLLDDCITDCQGGIDRWNKTIEKAGIAFRFTQPHKGFNRRIGEFARAHVSPQGELLSAEAWQARQGDWLCNDEDHAYINSLMKPCFEPGKCASWIVPPRRFFLSFAEGCHKQYLATPRRRLF